MVPTKLFFVITNKTSVIRTPFIRTLGYKNTPSMVPRGTFIGYKNTSAIRTPLRNVNGYKNTLSAERTVKKNVLAQLCETEKKRQAAWLSYLPQLTKKESTKNTSAAVIQVAT